jgi:tetratricopeptide (TPR) repeat protein
LEANEIRQLVAEKASFMERNDYYGVLGLEKGASSAEIQKAYFQLVKVLHPDRIERKGLGDIQSEAAALFKFATDAHAALSDPTKRKEYLSKAPTIDASSELQAQVADRSTQELLRENPSDLGISATEAAKIFFHKGAMLMKKGAYDEAEQFFARALEAEENNPRYNLQMGWAIFQNSNRRDTDRLAVARGHIETALSADAENPEAHYYMARLHKEAGQMDRCRHHLEAALKKRPNFIEVKRELRLLEMRQNKGIKRVPGGKGKSSAEKSGGSRLPFGLDKLFKRK